MRSDVCRCSASCPNVPAIPQQPEGSVASRSPKASKTVVHAVTADGAVARSVQWGSNQYVSAGSVRGLRVRPHPFAVLTPEQAAVAPCQLNDLLRHFTDQGLRSGRLHVDRRPDVQDTRVNVAEHAIIQTAPVERRSEIGDEVREF